MLNRPMLTHFIPFNTIKASYCSGLVNMLPMSLFSSSLNKHISGGDLIGDLNLFNWFTKKIHFFLLVVCVCIERFTESFMQGISLKPLIIYLYVNLWTCSLNKQLVESVRRSLFFH